MPNFYYWLYVYHYQLRNGANNMKLKAKML